MDRPFSNKDPLLDIINQVVLGEKKLTDAELKKREEIAQAIERDNPGMDMGKKMAIATAQAKKVAEEVDEIKELDEATVVSKKYSWGTMKTVHHGKDFSIPLHPEHHRAISKLKDEQEHNFKTEDGHHWNARRKGDDIHFQSANNGPKTVVKHSALQEEVEELDELSKKTLGDYIKHASGGMKGLAISAHYAGATDDKTEKEKMWKRALKRDKGIKMAADKLTKEEVKLDEHLENFWGAYTSMINEADDQQQMMLLRAMAKDPSDLMKMKRAIAMGDKALTNPVMRQEILKMLDQMMNLTVTDKALLQKTRSSFMKQKQFKAADTTNTEEYVPEEVEELDERNKENAMRRKMMDASRGARYKLANKVVPDREPEHKTAQAHNKAIGRALRSEEVEELDELSKDTLGNYIKKATTGMNGIAVNAHMSGSASSSEQREKHFDKAFKRGKGIAKAVDKLTKEEAEQIDEISKKTLGSYIKKASGDANDNAVRASWETSRIAVGDPNDPGNHGKANKYIRDLRNRKKGISRATDKLTKEEAEQVDEAGYDFTHYRKMQYAQTRAAQKADDKPPFEGGREVKSTKPAAERVKKIAKGMQKHYTKDKK